MRRRPGCLLASLVLLLSSVLLGASPASAELRPLDMQVSGGEETWHAENDFRLDWRRPPGAVIAAVGYRVRDAAGAVVVPEKRFGWDAVSIDHIHVPPRPGAYTAEVWLEGPHGERGPQESATLRFDDLRPRTARPLVPSGWILPSANLRIEPPAGPHPISGIRGYAVSIDRGAGGPPCAVPSRCALTETDLLGGIGDDTISPGLLPEGTNRVQVLAVSGAGVSSAQIGSAVVRVDATQPEVALAGVPTGWATGPVRLTARATDALSGMAGAGASSPFTAIAVDGGVPRIDHGDSAAVTVTGEGVHDVALYARDAAGNSGERSPDTALIRIDESGPALAFTRAQDPAEPERIEATFADVLSGPDPARGSIAVRRAGSRLPWVPLPTAVSVGRLLARWDSDPLPAGTYEFRATAYDAVGNAASTERRANGTRMVLANPAKARAAIAAGFGGRQLVWQRCSRRDGQRRCRRETIDSFEHRPTTRAVPYGKGIAYAGQLTSAVGARLGDLPIEITESFAAGAGASLRTTTVRTAADGSFLTRLAPGPSRRVEVTFSGTRKLAPASGGDVHLQVLGGVRLRASSASARIGGAPVVFDGRVGDLGAPIPPGGRPVELQFRLPGREWSEFRTVQTDAQGRFRYPYAFSDDDSRGIRFQFRAFVPAQDDWPYEPAASRPVFVTGR
jgi:hypothetical protein